MAGRARRLLSRELGLPAETLLGLAAAHPASYPVLFDSASTGPLSRHSILVAGSDDALWMDRNGRLAGSGEGIRYCADAAGFFDALERWWRDAVAAAPLESGGQPWCGGFAVFIGYELAAEVEPSLRLPAATLPLQAYAIRVRGALVAGQGGASLVVLAEPGEAGVRLLARLQADAMAVAGHAASSAGAAPAAAQAPSAAEAPAVLPVALGGLHEDPAAEFLERIARVQEAIRAGDLYQANLSRGWHARLRAGVSAASIYRRLRRVNPAPFAVWAQWGGFDILSSSPERLVRIEQRRISTRPIAGTRPRAAGGAPRADAAAAEALVAHPKERAEHVMLIDLERNDLGRVCEPGSVEVRDFMTVETYAHVHHIVSEVAGRLRAEVSPVAALRAVFPGGTITGCPKVRCMQIIGALEGRGRGAYTGSLGLLGLDGSADFNILIRTLTIVGDQVELRAGAGIVADSVPERELEETRAKARGVLAALGVVA